MSKTFLPIGVQTFKKIREGNYIYVDKTQWVYELAINEGHNFLSRPRRFGKSLFLNTLKELFLGNRELFKGLWVEDQWDWAQKSPVIHFSFANMPYKSIGLEQGILNALDDAAKVYAIEFDRTDMQSKFKELLEKLYAKHGQVVLLIDEYDKPIIDFLEAIKIPQAKDNQGVMKTFYSVLKDAEPFLRLTFITGVSKFSKVSIFSDLNHLNDLTLDKRFATAFGYTQMELEAHFEPQLSSIQERLKLNRTELLDKMKARYNGFSWDGIHTVYNPFGTLNFLEKEVFRNFWFSTGTPTFLTELMSQEVNFEYENIATNVLRLEKYDLDNLDIVALMFQTGYLTITEHDPMTDDIVLNYPNLEIKESLYVFMLDAIRHRKSNDSAQELVKDMNRAFRANNLMRVRELLDLMLGDLPYNLYEKDDRRSERFFHSIIHLTFRYLGIYVESEVSTARGRADSVVQTPTHVYIFEFKHKSTAEDAFQQILDKGYAKKYKGSGKTIVGIGVNFDKSKREIDGWKEDILN
jgi:hypothetical protein